MNAYLRPLTLCRYLLLAAVLMLFGWPRVAMSASLPVGFIETDIASGWDNPVGIAFGKNSAGNKERIYVWERHGRIWIVEDGVKLATPLLDIREEIADYGDHGLLGFALDPDFQTNGYFYALYGVDRHHLLYYGTPQYSSTTSIRAEATIGRITRFTARRSDDFRSVEPASRKILLGESKTTGIPIVHTSHGVGSLVFATDGTLMVSCGDGASFNAMDNGGTAGGAYGPQAVADGIITPAENVGAFRCQMLDSLDGKILRIDPATGDGVASNPFYQAGSPRSARSRVWAYGLRNPCRFSLQPGTGSHNPADGDPGTFFIGDVGWQTYEDMQVCDGPGQNFGWPIFEGYMQRPDYWAVRPAGLDAANHKRPVVDWLHGNVGARALYNGTIYNVGASGSPVTGTNFGGNAACGGTWYSGTDFPSEWRNVYYQSDFSGQWIRAFTLDGNYQLTNARPFASGESFVFLTTHPQTGGLYFCSVENATKRGAVRRISYAPGGNRPPTAVASVDRQYGASPLTVQFSCALSSDPDNTALTFLWTFGDGTTSTLANPTKTYTATGPKRFDVMLTVTDAGGATASSSLVITANNTPPVVRITNPGPGVQYSLTGDSTYDLTANVTDAEHALGTLTHQWQVTLAHDNHEHLDLTVNATTAAATFQALGNDPNSTYYYRITLRVTDPLGLTTVAEQLFLPQAGSAPIVVNPDYFSVPRGSGRMLDVLANDHGAVTDADFATYEILTPPAAGAVVPDPVTGRLRYLSNAAATAVTDTFTYRLKTRAGTLSPAGTVTVTITDAEANSQPVALGDAASVLRGQATLINVLANDTDPGGTLAPSSLVIHTRPVSGTVSVNAATGAITYAHNNSAITGDTFSYSVADAAGARSDITMVRIAVTTANGAPVLTNPGSQFSVRGSAVSLQLQASDPNGQPLTWSATGLPAGLSLNSSGLITGTVSASALNSNSVTITVSDGALSASVSFAWSTAAPPTGSGLLGEYFTGLTPGVNPPVLSRNDAAINFDWGVSGPSAATGVDNFSARWTGELIPRYTETYNFALPVDDGVRLWIDNVLVLDKWLPIGQSGWHNFTVNLTAGRRTPFRLEYYEQWGGAAITLYWFSARQAWEVIPAAVFVPAGAAPDATPPTATLTGPAGPVSGPFAVSVSFNESITGLSLTDFAVTNGTATLLDTGGGTNTLTVTPTAAGNVSVSLPAGRVQDGGGNGNTASNVFTVSYAPPANRAPAVTAPGTQTSLRGSIVSLQMQGSDPDGQALTWSASGLPAGLAINAGTGLIGGTVALTASSSYTVTVTARDPLGLSASTTFSWNTKAIGGSGIRGDYYQGATPGSGVPLLSRIDSAIDFDWGGGSPAAGIPVDNFSVRWSADMVPVYTEAYTLTVAADNGVRVYVNNTLVIDGWASPAWRSTTVNLTAGQRTPLRVDYYEGSGGAGISLYWNSARQPWEAIPASRLIPPAAVPGSAGTLLPAINLNYGINQDPAGATVISFTRPLTTGSAATVLEGSTNLIDWMPVDSPAVISRANGGFESIRVQVLTAPHIHEDGSVHQHTDGPPEMFYRVRLVENLESQ